MGILFSNQPPVASGSTIGDRVIQQYVQASRILGRSKSLPDLTSAINQTSVLPDAMGAYSDIYVLNNALDDRDIKVAVKMHRTCKNVENCPRISEHARQEREIYELQLDKKYIAEVFGVATIGRVPALVMKWYINGDIVTDIVEALKYLHMHTPTIIHGDLKARNVLVGEDGHAVLSDFGSARVLDQTEPSVVNWSGTVRWTAPEILNSLPMDDDDLPGPPTKESDIYSLGGTLAEVVTLKVPFQRYHYDVQIFTLVTRGDFPYTEESFLNADIPDGAEKVKELWEVLAPCWDMEPNQRPSVTELQTSLQSGTMSTR
ncbi:hypothetical protein JAAARDRAFT_204272 [Jaapia argillacea MUCL 33604]|uniref:Protein kinase domain-containing protein n=1 Tax=Jaapia argillacea MUCL 33604 TaxID=933084 RepID=A0A067Q6R7_9AGAM|nr:hypothetical protein JAAARDRAFT_204272 [Jaapia argillacea MUCL 33604]